MNEWRRRAGLALSFCAVILACFSFVDAVPAQTAPYQGFGTSTPGGSGGAVVRVTNLQDTGPGSLRDALSAGNRTVVFDVGGEIALSSAIRVSGAFITLDGFTAPGGITLRGAGLSLHGSNGAHDIVIRGIRIRDATATSSTDGITVAYGAYNIVIDHVSICCSADGNLDITYDSHNVTVSWSILAGTGKNMLIKYNASQVTLHHNVFTGNLTRNPQARVDDAGGVADVTTLDMRNNVVWNWDTGYGTLVWHGPRANIVNNLYSTGSDALSVSEARAFVEGNVTAEDVSLDGASTEAGPFPAPPVDTQDAWTAASAVLAGAGVRPLDAVDAAYLDAIAIADREPDLIVTALTNPPASAVSGSSFAVTDTVVNQGVGAVEESVIRYYLSTSASAVAAGSRLLPALSAGATSTGTATVTIPPTLPVGTYYLRACADDTGTAAESNETNNCRTSTSSILVSAPSTGSVDLIVSALSSPPASALLGGTFSVTDTVLNQGTASAGAWTTLYYLSLDPLRDAGDVLLAGTRPVLALAAGAASTGTVSVTIPSTLPAATYYLLACADDLAQVAESNEANNCAAAAATVQVTAPPAPPPSGADLVVSEMFNPPTAADPGASFGARDWVFNQGTASAGASTTRYYLSPDQVRDPADILLGGSRAVVAIGPGQFSKGSLTVTVPLTTPAGLYYLLACADDLNQVGEANELNNCRASTTRVQVGSPTATAPTTTAALTVTIAGSGSVAGPGIACGADCAESYAIGTSVTLTATPGSSSIFTGWTGGGCGAINPCTTVIGGAVTITATFAAAPAPPPAPGDLVVTAVGNPPTSAAPGGSFSATDTVANIGGSGVGGSATRYYFSQTSARTTSSVLLSGTRIVDALGPSATSAGGASVSIPSSLASGLYYLLACADDLAQVSEGNETNNCAAAATTVQVSAPSPPPTAPSATAPDLVVSEMFNPPATAAAGSSFGARDWVLNQGASTAGPSFTRYHLSLDAALGPGDILLGGSRAVSSLAPGQVSKSSITVTVPPSTPPGLYYLLACSDDTNQVVESNESNNCRVSQTRVQVGP